jgi:nitrite reductase/ring-hydroxylating ferredoxin subunit
VVAAFVTVGSGVEPGPGEVAAFEVGGEHIAVANVAGTLHAFGGLCPHRQCLLGEGDLEETVVTCPCHGSQFDVTTGERLRGPAVRGVPVYVVRLENGMLEIEI